VHQYICTEELFQAEKSVCRFRTNCEPWCHSQKQWMQLFDHRAVRNIIDIIDNWLADSARMSSRRLYELQGEWTQCDRQTEMNRIKTDHSSDCDSIHSWLVSISVLQQKCVSLNSLHATFIYGLKTCVFSATLSLRMSFFGLKDEPSSCSWSARR